MELDIEWYKIIVESMILSIIIFGAVFLEIWLYRKSEKIKEDNTRKRMLDLIHTDLQRKIRFINDSSEYKDYKPFFTDVWDAVVLSGKQTLFPFETIENLQHCYSWMKYYNTEIQQKNQTYNEKTLKEILDEVKKSIEHSLRILKE
ncbi:MAG: hypothetical protein K8Q88_01435 [Nitrosarchaeum sp.]|nr:hypothetical protein [Nitrosarchaeum sp.]